MPEAVHLLLQLRPNNRVAIYCAGTCSWAEAPAANPLIDICSHAELFKSYLPHNLSMRK